jgi:mannose-6-phosphate isomerase
VSLVRLKPVFKERVWGSTQLEPLFPNSDRKIGEVWFEGVDNLPLLIKFLFTTEKLSVQVHPNDEYARRHHDSPGKTEMWFVLRAEPGAQIAAGFREKITPARLHEASLSGEIEDLLQWHDAAPGDTFFIPAGTVHAIGAGLTLCEIQQHSDITYRLYDYGRPRELHLNRAVEVSHLGPHAARSKTQGDVLVSSPHFTTSRLCISNRTHEIHIPSGGFLIMVEGSGTLDGQPAQEGEVWYVEAGPRTYGVSGAGTFLHTLP